MQHPPAAASGAAPLLLYRHALESVFAFCPRGNFTTLPAVCRDWQAAVLSMAPLRWTLGSCGDDLLTRICQSPLRRHVSVLVTPSDPAGDADLVLPLLSERMPQLRNSPRLCRCSHPRRRCNSPRDWSHWILFASVQGANLLLWSRHLMQSLQLPPVWRSWRR